MMTKAKEMLELAQQLLDAAHYCTELPQLENHCREIAQKLEGLAEDGQPQTPRDPAVVAAVQHAILAHPLFDGGPALAFGLANTAIDAYTVAISRPDREDK